MALQAITKKIFKNKNSCREGGDLMDEPPQVNISSWREWIGLPDIGVPCIGAKLIQVPRLPLCTRLLSSTITERVSYGCVSA